MDWISLLFLLLLAALVWFWFDISLALARDRSGRRVLRRTYRFEFSETGNTRLEGQLILLGDKIETVTMEPYQILP